MISNKSKYDSAFTAGGLLLNEFLVLKPIIEDKNFEALIRVEEEQNNLIGISTLAARKRIIQEIRKRVKNAPDNFWNNFYQWNPTEQQLALFFLCLKTYSLLIDLHFEVTLKRYKTVGKLSTYDLQMRLDEIVSNDKYVASWSESTLQKVITRYKKIISEVGIYNEPDLLRCNYQNDIFWNYFKDHNAPWFLDACLLNNY